MLELIFAVGLLLIALIVLKLFILIFKVGFWALTLPLQILAGVGALLFALLIAVPLALIAGIVVLPLALLAALFPIILIGFGLYLLLKE